MTPFLPPTRYTERQNAILYFKHVVSSSIIAGNMASTCPELDNAKLNRVGLSEDSPVH